MRMYSLKTKMAVTVSLLVVLLIAAMASYIFAYFEKTFKEAISYQEFTLVAGMAQEIDNKLEIAHTALIAASKTVDPAILSDPDEAQAFLDARVGMKTMFDNHIYLFSSSGAIIAESPFVPGRRGGDYSHREYIRMTLETGRPYIGAPYVSSQAHRHPAIMLTAPVYGADGRLVAIMAGSLDLLKDNFLGALSRTKLGATGYVYIYNTDRTIIIHPEADRMLRQDVPVGANRLFDMAIQGFEGSEETINSRGVHHLATFKRLAKTDWILVANHPISEVYGPVMAARQYFIAAMVVGLLLLLFCIWMVAGHLTAPLVAFTHHVEDLGGKAGSDRFSSVVSNDEIGALSAAFNKMLRELDRKALSLEKSEELYRTITDFASDMVFWRGPAGDIYYVSPNCERVTGYRDSEFYASPRLIDDIVANEDRDRWLAYVSGERVSAAGALEIRIVTKGGEARWISCAARPVFNERGEYCGLRGSHQDINDRKLAEEKLHFISMHDSLTGFKNRASFENELASFARPECLPVSVIVCDVDGLKFVNDTLGHDAGDRLLTRVAAILTDYFAGAPVYRIGGDEFVIVLADTGPNQVDKSCRRLRAAIACAGGDESEMPISVSIGFATSDKTGADMAMLFKEADDNMYREKLHHSQSVRSTTLTALAKALEVRDFGEDGHAERVRDYAYMLGSRLGMADKALTEIGLLAQFHDIGKVGVPDGILFKEERLTRKEREIIERHAEIGYRIAISVPDLAPIADLILKHHEWWNGAGYPLRLKGEQIPLECRIMAIADAYDAMTSRRPYREAMPAAEALTELERCAGSQFDPQLVAMFGDGMKRRRQG